LARASFRCSRSSRFASLLRRPGTHSNAIDHHRHFVEGAAFPPRSEGRGLHAEHPMNASSQRMAVGGRPEASP
jgi:hypothetical protein